MMEAKHLVVVLLALWTVPSIQADQQPTLLDNYAMQGLEKLRGIIEKGMDLGFMAIPKLDPLNLENIAVNLDQQPMMLSANLKEFSLTGLKDFKVSVLSISLANSEITVKVSFPEIGAKGSFKADGKVSAKVLDVNVPIPIEGDGTFSASFADLAVDITVGLTVTDKGQIQMGAMDFHWTMSNPKVDVQGLYEGKELGHVINNVVADALPHIVEKYNEKITAAVLKVAKEPLNKLLLSLHMDSAYEEEAEDTPSTPAPSPALASAAHLLNAEVAPEGDGPIMEIPIHAEPISVDLPPEALRELLETHELHKGMHPAILRKIEEGTATKMEIRLVGPAKIYPHGTLLNHW